MLKIGCIDYVNAMPLFYALQKKIVPIEADFLLGPPTFINQKLTNAEINASLISSVTYLKNKKKYKLIKPFGIAAKGAVNSVFLYKKSTTPKIIALTNESATSVELLKILCREKWKITPQFIRTDDFNNQEAFLVIGDKALKESYEGYEAIDLALEWFNHFKYPFPFAVIVTDNNNNNETISYLQKKIEESLKWAENHRDLIILEASNRLNLPQHKLDYYFNLLTYRLDDDEYMGLNLFEKNLKEHVYE